MYELLLCGQVPVGRHDQVLKIIAGVAAMQPRHILQRCAIYRPIREPEEPGSNLRRGGTQNVAQKQTKQTAAPALYYTKLIQKLVVDDFGTEDEAQLGDAGSLSADVKEGEKSNWSIRFEDIPDTADRGVSMRFTNNTDIVSGDPHAQMIAAGPNRFVTEYYIEGHRFVRGNVVIFLHRVLHQPGVRSVQEKPKAKLPAFASLELLDTSGAYILEAKVRVQDPRDANVLDAGVNEMKAFQKDMKGCVELSVPDRLSLDTRVRYKPPQTAAPAVQNRPR